MMSTLEVCSKDSAVSGLCNKTFMTSVLKFAVKILQSQDFVINPDVSTEVCCKVSAVSNFCHWNSSDMSFQFAVSFCSHKTLHLNTHDISTNRLLKMCYSNSLLQLLRLIRAKWLKCWTVFWCHQQSNRSVKRYLCNKTLEM